MRGKLLIGTAAICLLVLTPSLLLAQMAARERSEIDEQYRWDLSDIFVSDEAWEADFAKWEKRIARYGKFQGKLAEDAKTLAACLKFDLDFDRLGSQ